MSSVACKICESEIPVDKLLEHSTQCKQVAELKERLAQFTATMESYAEEATALKNRLETYAHKKKKFSKKINRCGSGILTDPDSPRLQTEPLSETSFCKFDLDMDTSICEEDKSDERPITRAITRELTMDRQDFLDLKKMTDEEQDKVITEAKKSVFALKKVIAYANKTSGWTQGNDLDFDVKNELEVIYDDISDPKVSSFLKSFMEDLEKYIELKRQYVKESTKLGSIACEEQYKHLKQVFQLNKSRSSKHVRGLFIRTPKSAFKEDSSFGGPESPEPITKSNTLNAKSFTEFNLLSTDSSASKVTLLPPRSLSGETAQNPHPPVRVVQKSLFSGSRTVKKESELLQEKSIEEPKPQIEEVKENVMEAQAIEAQVEQEKKDEQMIFDEEHLNRVAKYREHTKSRKNRSTVAVSKGLESPLKLKNRKESEPFKIKDDHVEEEKLSPKKITTTKGAPSKHKRSTSMESLRSGITEDEILTIVSPLLYPKKEHGKDNVILSGENSPNRNKYALMKKPSEISPNLWESPMMRGYHSDTSTNTTKRTALVPEDKEVSLEDFEPIKFLGKGAYGTVWLVRKKATGDEYAMKIVDSADRGKQNRLSALKAERDIYKVIEGDFVVKAVWTFHHENYICFVTELMIGGDFNKLLDNFGRFDEEQARFYFAELVLAVESLHNLGIVHRDLKPDNMLMDARGHIRLTDFGLSRPGFNQAIEQTKPIDEQCNKYKLQRQTSIFDSWHKEVENPKELRSLERKPSKYKIDKEPLSRKKMMMVGTPDYMAPEAINPDLIGTEENYNEQAMDWWSMGVILYQLLIGVPPFCGDSVEEVFDNVKNYRIDWPAIGYEEDEISPDAVDLITKLLERNPIKRLGSHGVLEVKNHPFMKGFDWKGIREKDGLIIPFSPDGSPTELPIDSDNKEPKFPLSSSSSTMSSPANQPMHLKTFKMIRLDVLDKLNKETFQRLQTIDLSNQSKGS